MYDFYSTYPQLAQKLEIIHVNGEMGAKAFRMGANSSALLLDDTAPIVWLAQTDGAGYLSVTPFKIEEVKPEPPKEWKDFDERLKRIEEMLNAQSNTNKTTKKSTTTELNAT